MLTGLSGCCVCLTKAQSQTSFGINRRISSNRCLDHGNRTHSIPAAGYGVVIPPRPKQAGMLVIGGHNDLGTNLNGSPNKQDLSRFPTSPTPLQQCRAAATTAPATSFTFPWASATSQKAAEDEKDSKSSGLTWIRKKYH